MQIPTDLEHGMTLRPARQAAGRLERSRLVQAALRLLPKAIRPSPYRHVVLRASGAPSDLSLRIACTRDELTACYRLLHEAYVGRGYMKPHPSGLRITQHNALPTTTTLLAESGGKVVGTLTLIRENGLGLPVQSICDLERVRGRVAEVSGLAISEAARRRGRQVLFALMKFAYVYARDCFDIQHFVIAVHPRRYPFYAALGFRYLADETEQPYEFANGAPAVVAHLDLQRGSVYLRRRYARLHGDRNLYRYFCATPLSHASLPEARFFDPDRRVMTPDLLHHFFVEKTSILERLGGREKTMLKALYDTPEYVAALPASYSRLVVSNMPVRKHLRFEIDQPAELIVNNQPFPSRHRVQLVQASHGGLVARIAESLPRTAAGELVVPLDGNARSTLQVRLTRRLSQARYAFHIEQEDEGWHNFVERLQRAAIDMELDRVTVFLRATNAR